MKPKEELLIIASQIGDKIMANRLGCTSEFINSWRERPRALPDGRTVIEPGWEPSSGFMAMALVLLDDKRV